MTMTTKIKTDIEIAQETKLKRIQDIASELDLLEEEIEPYGHYKAKISLHALKRLATKQDGHVILVTSINPTPAGEGKSTVTVGLGQALHKMGKKVIIAMREPSLGPTMGIKGGATGGGYSQVLPMEDINLHFTGDLHAITTANNFLAALIDNHIHQGNELRIDTRRIVWKRAVDLNDRALRKVVVGLGGPTQGVPREDGFDITVASEIMAVFCLATDLQDLKQRLAKMVVAYNVDRQPVTVADLGVEGALTLLLKDALKPNLVQTVEHVPALVHGGPFANIAHGCNSVIATKMAQKLGDYVVTEAGFGADLGAEKFLHIKARTAGINLEKHIETIQAFGLPFVVAINRFITDTDKEIQALTAFCEEKEYPVSLTEVWEKGGDGGIDLAHKVLEVIENTRSTYTPLYELDEPITDKIQKIARDVYGASDVSFSDKAKKQIEQFTSFGWDKLPICMAKTQYSLSDDPTKLGRPTDFTITVRELKPSIGAGFLVALTGDVMTMPGLPKQPAALQMDIDEHGNARGLF